MKATEWQYYLESGKRTILYRCPVCKGHNGKMQYRDVTEENAGTTRQYRIVCTSCMHKGSVHWHRALAEKTWEAEGRNNE